MYCKKPSKLQAQANFHEKNIYAFDSYRKNSIFRTSVILELAIFNSITYGYISNRNFTANSEQ